MAMPEQVPSELKLRADQTAKTFREFTGEASRLVSDLALEGLGTIIAIGLIALADHLIETWIGPSKKFFDYIPVQWVFDAAHLMILVRLVWGAIARISKS
jgi:hypothetical protein